MTTTTTTTSTTITTTTGSPSSRNSLATEAVSQSVSQEWKIAFILLGNFLRNNASRAPGARTDGVVLVAMAVVGCHRLHRRSATQAVAYTHASALASLERSRTELARCYLDENSRPNNLHIESSNAKHFWVRSHSARIRRRYRTCFKSLFPAMLPRRSTSDTRGRLLSVVGSIGSQLQELTSHLSKTFPNSRNSGSSLFCTQVVVGSADFSAHWTSVRPYFLGR